MVTRNSRIANNFQEVLIGNKFVLRETVSNSAMGLEFAQKSLQAMVDDVYNVPFVELSTKIGQVVPSGGVSVIFPRYETSSKLFDTLPFVDNYNLVNQNFFVFLKLIKEKELE